MEKVSILVALEGITDPNEMVSLQKIVAVEIGIKTMHATVGADGFALDTLVAVRRDLIKKHNSLYSEYVETPYY